MKLFKTKSSKFTYWNGSKEIKKWGSTHYVYFVDKINKIEKE